MPMHVKTILCAGLLLLSRFVSGQEYIIQGTSPDLHLAHAVAAKETWYSIGRTYNLSPKDLAAYNRLSLSAPLEIGQQIRVPLTAVNFSQTDGNRGTPVYHVVQPREWLYRISVNYNKVPVDLLQKWNGIGKDGAKPGTRLIVGYLLAKPGTSAGGVAKADPQPAATTVTSPVTADAKPATREEPKPATREESKATPATHEQPKPSETAHEQKSVPSPHSTSSVSPGSYFQGQYGDGTHAISGVAGIFKSTSGWKDGKYYALVNNVPVGTIVQVTLPSTGKLVYAKVLGELPEMKENAGLGLRISDAAAYELGTPENKFSVELKY